MLLFFSVKYAGTCIWNLSNILYVNISKNRSSATLCFNYGTQQYLWNTIILNLKEGKR